MLLTSIGARLSRRRATSSLFVLIMATTPTGYLRAAAPVNVDKLIIVNCLLLGDERVLGGKVHYLGPRRSAQLSIDDCERQGGEYAANDPANYPHALKLWLPQAKSGDPKAQVYVGEIYEKGVGGGPDYVEALAWYEQAANKGDIQGLNHSAYLYEQGLGVPKDTVRALNLYRRAAGLKGDDLTYVSDVTEARKEAQLQIDSLTAQLEDRDYTASALAKTLDDTRQQLKDDEARAAKARQEIDALHKKMRQLQSAPQTTANAGELERLKSQLADRERQISSQSTEIDNLQRASSDQDAALRERLAAAEKADGILQQQLGVAQARAATATAQLASVQATAHALDEASGKLRADLQTNETALSAARAQLAVALSAVGSAKNAQSEKLKATVAQQEVDLERQKAVISALQGQREHLEEEAHRLQANTESSHDQESQATSAVADLRARLASANTDLLRNTQQKAELGAKLEAAARQLSEDSKALSASAAALGAKNVEVQRLNTELGNREATVTGQRAQLVALNVAIAGDNDRLKDYDDKLKSLTITRGPPAAAASGPGEPIPPELKRGQHYALIIGNSTYAHMGQLNTAEKDAVDIGALFSKRYGFEGHVRTLLNANHEAMVRALYEIVSATGEEDSLIVYYAGHGAIKGDAGFWLPTDADEENPGNWISDHDITEWVSATKARHVLIIADSCYAGAMTRGTTPELKSSGSPDAQRKRIVLLAKLRSRTVLTSGGVEPVLDGGPEGHSIFAHEFIELLSQNTQVLEATVLYNNLADRVRLSAMKVGGMTGKSISQIPQIAWLTDAGHETGGEFLFVPEVLGPSAGSEQKGSANFDAMLNASNRFSTPK